MIQSTVCMNAALISRLNFSKGLIVYQQQITNESLWVHDNKSKIEAREHVRVCSNVCVCERDGATGWGVLVNLDDALALSAVMVYMYCLCVDKC